MVGFGSGRGEGVWGERCLCCAVCRKKERGGDGYIAWMPFYQKSPCSVKLFQNSPYFMKKYLVVF
jgi:hypothetical protein